MPQAIAGAIITATGAGAVGAALITGVVQLTTGLLLAAVFAPEPPEQPEVQGTDGRVNFTASIGARTKHYGRVLRGGQVVFGTASGGYLYRIFVHGHGQIDRVVEYRIDERQRDVEPDGRVLSMPYNYGDLGSLIRLEGRRGMVPETFYSGPGEAVSQWGTDYRLDGLWSSYMRAQQRAAAEQTETYPLGAPSLQALADTSRVFDPRSQETGYSDNAALVIADWIESADGFNLPGTLDQADLVAAADAADALRQLSSGGSRPFWRLAGSASMAAAPEVALQGMLRACAGDVRLKPDGTISLNIGGDPAPVVTLTDADVLEILRLDDGPDALDRFTELPFSYVDEDLDYSETTGQAWINALEETRIGGSDVGDLANLSWAPNHAQARHAAKILSFRANPPQRASIKFKMSGLPAIFERTVTLDIQSLGLTGTWRVTPSNLNLQEGTITLGLSQIVGSPEAWDVTEEGQPESLPSDESDSDAPAAPGDVQAFGQGSGGAGIFVAFDAPASENTQHYVAYKLASVANWTAFPTAANATTAQVTGLVDGELYDVAVIAARSEIFDPQAEEATATIVPNVEALSTVPQPDAPVLAVSNSGAGTALVQVTASASAFGRTTEILRDASLVFSQRTTPGQEIAFSDASGAGTFTWTARAVSLSGQATTSSGETQTIT